MGTCFPIALLLATPAAADTLPHINWSASIFGSTSTLINGRSSPKPQYGFEVSGERGALSLNARVATIDSWVGADSEDKITLAYSQPLQPFHLRYQIQYKAYPGTKSGYTDQALVYQMTASRSFFGVNYALGAEYSDNDYTSIRKSYGLNASVSRSLLPKLSGWISVSHHHQFGSVDYTNTNMGLYYQLTPKIGVSASVNDWHAQADWYRYQPSVSISLSRRL